MSLLGHSRRLGALEAADGERDAAFVWREQGETAEQAVARHFPQGVPAGTEVMVVGWMG
jgi:hypothetical protein